MTLDAAIAVARQVLEGLTNYSQPDFELKMLADAQAKLDQFQEVAHKAEKEFLDDSDR